VTTVYPPVSFRSLGGYNKEALTGFKETGANGDYAMHLPVNSWHFASHNTLIECCHLVIHTIISIHPLVKPNFATLNKLKKNPDQNPGCSKV